MKGGNKRVPQTRLTLTGPKPLWVCSGCQFVAVSSRGLSHHLSFFPGCPADPELTPGARRALGLPEGSQ